MKEIPCCLAEHTRKVCYHAMELRHLRYFVVVAEEQNITRAAVRLHVSQPPLSRQIRDLEQELGVALFERSAQSVRLTEAGSAFLGEARAVLFRVDQAVDKVRAVGSQCAGVLRVGYAPSPTVELLPPALRAFGKALPRVKVLLHDMTGGEMLEGLNHDKLDVVLIVKPALKSTRGMNVETLREYRVGIAIPPGHPFTKRKGVTVKEAAAEPLVAYSRKDYPDYFEMLERLLGKAFKTIQVVEECDGAMSLITAVESGRGVSVAAESITCIAGGRVGFVPFSPAPEPLVVSMVWRKGVLNAQTQRFIDTLRKVSVEVASKAKTR
ncbi:MAG: hypothetical protein JWO94_2128 [Verrucomicrobiaceae bacterium]|nr:hypothetical protein [Verrucomicrobiaceae bacterium]